MSVNVTGSVNLQEGDELYLRYQNFLSVSDGKGSCHSQSVMKQGF